MPNMQRTALVTDFKGIDERREWNSDKRWTSSQDNVVVENGVIKGRKGLTLWDGITAVPTNQIIGLWDFYAPSTATSKFVRMTTTTFEEWDDAGNQWTDRTGTALTGLVTTRPSFANMSDEGFMVFTNDGEDLPRKWTGSGNTSNLGTNTPYAKWLSPYVGFLFLFNTSTDGTFAATADSITAYFNDDPDGDWSPCQPNRIIYDESPGELRCADVIGDIMVVGKADCLVQTKFTVGVVRFARQRMKFAHGVLAPMSFKKVGNKGIIFLASDRNLYITDGYSIKPLPLNVQRSLRDVMDEAKAPYVSAAVDETRNTYYLLFQRSATTYYDGILSYNYMTGEFNRQVFSGYEFTRIHAFKQTNNVDTQVVVSGNDKKVYEVFAGTDDSGTSVSRFYDVDWTNFGTPGNKWLNAVELTFARAAQCRVRVSVAVDKSDNFTQPKFFTLQGRDVDETDVRVNYELKQPIFGTWFRIRIQMYHDAATNVCELKHIEPELTPVHPSDETTGRSPQPLSV